MSKRLVAICLLTLLVSLLLLPPPVPLAATANTYYVDAGSGDDGTGDGSAAGPWRTITRALDATVAGDTVIARPGTYGQALGETLPILLPAGVSLVGAGCDSTIVAGQSDKAVLSIGNKTEDFTSTTRVLSLTLTGGSIGLEMYSSELHTVSPVIDSLCIRQNATGIRMSTSAAYEDGATIAPVITGTAVVSNTQDGISMTSYGYFAPSGVTPVITNCVVGANGGHGLYVEGKAVGHNGTYAAPELYGCRVTGNGGDGVHATASYQGWSRPQLDGCWIADNGGYGLRWLLGINSGNVDATLANVVVAANRTGGIRIGPRGRDSGACAVHVLNCTLVGNSGHGIYWERGTYEVAPSVVNTVLWNVDADDLYSTGDPWTQDQVKYCDIEDGDLVGQQGNISWDPRLTEDYHLTACSPAMDAGTATGAPATDIDGEPRPQGSAPDIGADEYDAPCLLGVGKTVSQTHARCGDVLTYTITLTNTTVITPLNVLITDVLPTAVAYVAGSLDVSQGSAACTSGVVTWSDTLDPQAAASISLQTRVVAGGTSAANVAIANAEGSGIVASPTCRTDIDSDSLYCYLPAVMRNYCSGSILDDFSNPASGWPVAESEVWSIGYLSGQYRMYAKQGPALSAVARGGDVKPVVIEVDVRQASAINGSLGIVYGLNADWSNLYTFEVYPATREYAVFHYYQNEWYLLEYGTSTAINSGQASNRLRVHWEPNTLHFEANGQLLTTLYAPSPVLGRVGLVAEASAAGFDARFDNFKLVPEGCPEFSAAAQGELRDTMEATRPWQWDE